MTGFFTNLLASVDHAAASPTIFEPVPALGQASLAQSLPIPSITMPEDMPSLATDPALTISLPFWPSPISMRKVWLMMDGLLIVSGVLLFWVVFLAIAHSLPSWPLTSGVAIAIAIGFGFAYRMLVSDLRNRISGMLSGNSRCGRRNPRQDPRPGSRAALPLTSGDSDVMGIREDRTNQLRRNDHQIKH